jgi:hypothetical protein
MLRVALLSLLVAVTLAQDQTGTRQDFATVVKSCQQDATIQSSCKDYISRNLLSDIEVCQPESFVRLAQQPNMENLRGTLDGICNQNMCRGAVKKAIDNLTSRCKAEIGSNRNVQLVRFMVNLIDPMFDVACSRGQTGQYCVSELVDNFKDDVNRIVSIQSQQQGMQVIQSLDRNKVCTDCNQRMVGSSLGWIDRANAGDISQASVLITGLSAFISDKCGNEFVTTAKTRYGKSTAGTATGIAFSAVAGFAALYTLVSTQLL